MSNCNYISGLARFRCSNHKLVIKEGRHNANNLENRLCKYCNGIHLVARGRFVKIVECLKIHNDGMTTVITPTFL